MCRRLRIAGWAPKPRQRILSFVLVPVVLVPVVLVPFVLVSVVLLCRPAAGRRGGEFR